MTDQPDENKLTASKPVHYVDNAAFFAAICEWIEAKEKALAEGKPVPRIPEYVGECILKIATKLSYSPSFINYRYREDMVSDGVATCINYFHNFDPNKTSNPFSYFTQVIYYAFLRRIQREKRQMYIRFKMAANQSTFNQLADYNEFDIDGEHEVKYEENNEYMNEFVKNWESSMERKRTERDKAKAKKGTLDEFIDDEGDD